MAQSLDTDEFVRDYREGLRDRDILLKHGLSPKEMIQLVKRLINEGVINKDDYFKRTRTIKKIEAGEEQEFLKSLHQCPVCGHLHPVPFSRCPACGTDLAQAKDAAAPVRLEQSTAQAASDPTQSVSPRAGDDGGRSVVRAATKTVEEPVLSEALRRMIGMGLENPSYVSWLSERLSGVDYRITEVVSAGSKAIALKAEDPEESSPPVTVKIFNPELVGQADLDEFVTKIFTYQSNMKDPNVVRAVGTATLDEAKVILYEYLPVNMETVLRREPSGLSTDLLTRILPQVLNGLGYCHLHRGRDGVVRKLPHLDLRPSKLLMDRDMNVAKIDDCGVTRALFAVRGPKKYLWEEFGADLSSLAPESFVIETRSLDLLLVDMYALGTMLYRLATGAPAFSCSDLEEYKFAHLKKYAVPPRVHRYDIPRWLDTMILKCLEKEPDERWRSATQMELAVGKG